MKKLLALFSLALIIFTACSKEQIIEPLNTQQVSSKQNNQNQNFEEVDALGHKHSIPTDSLPAIITDYISANYTGDTILIAFQTSENDTLTGYSVIITQNGQKVKLSFDAEGNFISAQPIGTPGNHTPAVFTEIPADSLSTTISDYINTTYPGSTIVKAVEVSKNGTLKNTTVTIQTDTQTILLTFDAEGNLIKTKILGEGGGNGNGGNGNGGQGGGLESTPISADSLSTTISDYLNTTYPGNTFVSAAQISKNDVLKGYVVTIQNGDQTILLTFDAEGNLIKTKILGQGNGNGNGHGHHGGHH